MQKTERIDHYLPCRFKSGAIIKQFSKPCVQCGQMLQAKHMHGIARLVEDHLALAATADCPACHAKFGVACVIDNEKRVRRVVLPVWGFKLYLRLLPEQAGELAAREAARAQLAAERPAQPAAPVDYPRADTALGQYAGKPIPAHIVVDGRQVPFDRIELTGKIAPGEYLLDGHLVYKP
ncbi:hypothetical protein [Chitinimonas sp.]|uniref:hypothetical protein n=1 Tax=Chitinimonas sp. TaxID=1934313 RepID=UPI0035B0B6DA